MQQTTFVTLLVLTVGFTGVCWSQNELLNAFNSLDEGSKSAFNALGPNLLTELIDASTCITQQLATLNLCNFNTSVDPFYYVQKCLNGTTVQKLVQEFVQGVPVANLSFGVPQKVSNDRCDCDLVPLQTSCLSTPPTLPPATLPPATLPPGTLGPSIFGKR